jgi:RNase adaptor protein for sRNA GlmZ degradation
MGIVVLTGASGAGKTTIAQAFSRHHPTLAQVHFFDRIGVPSMEEMIARHGSPDEWQRQKTIEWMHKLAAEMRSRPNILFDGQTRCEFVRQGQKEANIGDVRIVLIDCDDTTRTHRLTHDRRQPVLANERMMNWARFLRNEAEKEGEMILDTSRLSVEEAVARLRVYFDAPGGVSCNSRAPSPSSSR